MSDHIAFTRGLATLLLTHARKLSEVDRAYIQTVADATTEDQMLACWRASAGYAASAASSAYAAASASAVKAGVPEEAIAALRALTLGGK